MGLSNDQDKSFDMNVDSIEDRPNGWPNDYSDLGRSWLHSDIKDVSYFFTYPKFDTMVRQGGLK